MSKQWAVGGYTALAKMQRNLPTRSRTKLDWQKLQLRNLQASLSNLRKSSQFGTSSFYLKLDVRAAGEKV